MDSNIGNYLYFILKWNFFCVINREMELCLNEINVFHF